MLQLVLNKLMEKNQKKFIMTKIRRFIKDICNLKKRKKKSFVNELLTSVVVAVVDIHSVSRNWVCVANSQVLHSHFLEHIFRPSKSVKLI